LAESGRSLNPIQKDFDASIRHVTSDMERQNLDSEIRSRIETFLEEISTLLKKAALESVRAALGDGATPVRRGPGRPPKSAATRGGGGKRSSEQVDEMAGRILAYVKSNAGESLEAISRAIGVPTKELKLPVIKLLGSRQLKKTGQKRGTKYFAGSGKGGATARKAGRKGRRKGARGKRGRKARPMAAAA
jgi:hypothetical protein